MLFIVVYWELKTLTFYRLFFIWFLTIILSVYAMMSYIEYLVCLVVQCMSYLTKSALLALWFAQKSE